jgi:hypothetical protein
MNEANTLADYEKAAEARGIPRSIWNIDEYGLRKGFLRVRVTAAGKSRLAVDCLTGRQWLADPDIVAEIICSTYIKAHGIARATRTGSVIKVSAECTDYRGWLIGIHNQELVAETFHKDNTLASREHITPLWEEADDNNTNARIGKNTAAV